MGEPCCLCASDNTGPAARTPHGICPDCACTTCRGFRRFDDRGFLCSGSWPSLFFEDCAACGGAGTRSTQAASAFAGEVSDGTVTALAWWVFQTPGSVAYVPAASEQKARSALATHCYKDAPVDSWPLIATRVCSRAVLHAAAATDNRKDETR